MNPAENKSLIKKLFDIAMIILGFGIIVINIVNALTGDLSPEWYWRLIGVIALIGAPSIIRDHSSTWIKEAILKWEKTDS